VGVVSIGEIRTTNRRGRTPAFDLTTPAEASAGKRIKKKSKPKTQPRAFGMVLE
jgi:hypothetical protein